MSCWSCFHRLGVYVRDIQSKACFPNAQPTVVGFKQSERQNLFKSQILKKASICLVICKTKSTPFEIEWYPTNVHDWGKNQGARNRISSVSGRQRRFWGGRRTVLDGTSHAEGKYVQLQSKTRPGQTEPFLIHFLLHSISFDCWPLAMSRDAHTKYCLGGGGQLLLPLIRF